MPGDDLGVAAGREVEVKERDRDRGERQHESEESVPKKLIVARRVRHEDDDHTRDGPVTTSTSSSTDVIAATRHQCPRTTLRLPRNASRRGDLEGRDCWTKAQSTAFLTA